MANISLCFLLILCTNVYNILAERNVAVGKPTNQSSTQYGGVSSRAVDGNTDANYYNGHCSHTADKTVNWWCVDLGETIDIERVKIYNLKFKLTFSQYRLKAFEIKLSSSGSCDKPGFDNATSCYKNPYTIQAVYTVEQCNQGTTSFTGRFVFISVNTNLVMCEVEIFEKCSINCKGDICGTSGVCNGCIDGRYGNQCYQPCSTWCSGGCIQSNGICNGCNVGRYGEYCNKICSAGCTNQCSKPDGTCSCKNTHYDPKCTSRCSTNCQYGSCSSTSQNPLQPQCTSGCIDGYKGSYCQTECPTNCLICDTSSCSVCKPGWYGTNCQSECSMNCVNGCQILDGKCNQCKPGTVGDYCNTTCDGCLYNGILSTCDRNGTCYLGCIDGKSGGKCDKMCKQYCTVCQNNDTNSCLTCTDGRFGISCDELCNTNCASATHESNPICNISSGFCTLGCKNGIYGNDCNTTCNGLCHNTGCGRMTGLCSEGCILGKTGDTCSEDCPTDTYGKNCSSICGKCADGISCNISSGVCGLLGCQEGFTGQECKVAVKIPPTNTTLIISVVVVVLVLLVVVIVVGIIFIKRRRMTKHSKEPISSPVVFKSPAVENMAYTNPEPKEAAEVIYANIQHNEVLVYQNLPDHQRSTTCIDLVNIWDYIQTKKEKKEFSAEFQKLPKGLCQPYEFCMNAINRPKNRYQNICAFDHTRVKLEVEDGDPNSDYMNACYISTYGNSEDKYIASQGPNAVNINEYVRMIWDVDASKIVMVTNFFEDAVEKCLNYTPWPNEGKAKKFGKISIKVISEDVYAHFTIRQLNITKDGCNARTLKQYHYTSWPDKGVPADIASLVEFRHHVKTSIAKRPGPMIVHCSAGIGRTGTFLALDYLINEGIAENSVDVFSCLSRMRKERVNMIQTVGQYIFLHDALAVWYLTADSTTTVTSYQQVYQQLLTVNTDTGRSRLQQKYQMMNKICNKQNKGEYTAALLPENTSKNRDPNILASDRSRTYLQVIYSNTTDYINAVNLSSYKDKNGYILTQTPLPNTVTDFWVLVIQSETNTIIDLSGDVKSRKDIGEYIPREMVVDCDAYTITKNNEKKHQSGLFNVITCRITSKSEEDFDRTVRIYECNFWKNEQEIPKSANLILCLLEEINSLSNNTTADPVVVHCLNGVDRGGLFCVLAAVLERLTIEQDVGVLQTIMQLRIQRPQIIISYEQFKFCFDAVGEYLDNFSTYANSC